MPRRIFASLILPFLFVSGAAAADKISGVPDLYLSEFVGRATEPVSVLICPDGDGHALSAARTIDSRVLDATVDVILRDTGNYPIVLFPAEDIWIQVEGLNMPYWGSIADHPTSFDGATEFALPRRGGGSVVEGDLYVYVNGESLRHAPITNIRFNSPDLNGDLIINLIDVARFTAIIHTEYDYAADFHWDGEINTADLGIFAQHYGHRYE
jgi:hypothetical protein